MAEEEPQARLPPVQCCCQERTGLSDFDKIIWKDTLESHRKSEQSDHGGSGPPGPVPVFVKVVSSRLPLVHRWLYRLYHMREPEVRYGLSLNLAGVQRMHLRLLQGRLTWLALSAGFDARENRDVDQEVPITLGPALREYGAIPYVYVSSSVLLSIRFRGEEIYPMEVASSSRTSSPVQAVRDHEYMGRFGGQRDDPFVVSSERFLDAMTLDKAQLRKDLFIGGHPYFQKKASATGPWENGTGPMRPVGGTRTEAFKHAFYSRVAGALVAAAFLIGPMWLLVLKQDVFLQLGVTTGCIAAFGLVMVVSLGTLDAVFAATLAYAAVLMVFVGVVMQGLSGNS